ncbi:MAG: hypothetical protein M1818_004860 [Claussenomyces sp. TS43310]|nr:MAG: hypothetical protein M1818_004860 [Claussenomyces sp. TS43310]
MAHCLRRRPFPPSLSMLQRSVRSFGERNFGTVSSLRGNSPSTRLQKAPEPPPRTQRSMRVAQKISGKMMETTDLGLLPMTFINPTGANRPNIFKQPRQLAKLQWFRIKRKAMDLFSIAVYRWSHRKIIKVRFRQTGPTAVALHRRMYTAFAEGDVDTLRKICADGILETLVARIRQRKSETVKWELIKYNKRERVMSNRAAALMIEGSGIRQAVVRISSQQSLTRFYVDGSIVPGTGKRKDVQEYIVIQKRLLHGKEEDWVVWGTTEESTLESVAESKLQELA